MRVKSIDELPPHLRAQVEACIATAPAVPKRNKYGARATVVDGIRFPSKLEAERYEWLKRMRETQEPYEGRVLRWFALWPRFTLPGGVIYEADSLQVWARLLWRPVEQSQTVVIVEDVKGHDTRESRNKRKLVAALYGVHVQLWPPR